jgi:hypothetical protein
MEYEGPEGAILEELNVEMDRVVEPLLSALAHLLRAALILVFFL